MKQQQINKISKLFQHTQNNNLPWKTRTNVVHKNVSQDCNKIRKSKSKKNMQPLKNFLKFP